MSPKQGRNPPALVEGQLQNSMSQRLSHLRPSQEWNSDMHGTQSNVTVRWTHTEFPYVALSDDFCILVAPESDFPPKLLLRAGRIIDEMRPQGRRILAEFRFQLSDLHRIWSYLTQDPQTPVASDRISICRSLNHYR